MRGQLQSTEPECLSDQTFPSHVRLGLAIPSTSIFPKPLGLRAPMTGSDAEEKFLRIIALECVEQR